jgi:putative tricarboxylic transport membrane protein
MSAPEREDRPAASRRAVELVTAAAIFAFGALVVFDSVRLGWRWASDGPEAGYFPFYIGAAICISAAVVFAAALRDAALGARAFVGRAQLGMILKFLLPSAVYVFLIRGIELGALEWNGLGIYVASTLFIAFFMLWLGKYSIAKTLPVAVGVSLAFFLVFEVWFKVPLPKGPLEALLGYG